MAVATLIHAGIVVAAGAYGLNANWASLDATGASLACGLLALGGRAATLAILLEGRVFGADEARGLGLLTRIVDDGEVAVAARRSADRIAQGAPLAARINKRLSARLATGAALTEDEYQDYFSYAESRDHREGVRAFLAGEDPSFSGD